MPGLPRVTVFWALYADYRVMAIDDAYTAALVGSGGADYLWILSRTPRLDRKMKESLLAEASRRGYDTSRFLWVKKSSQQSVA